MTLHEGNVWKNSFLLLLEKELKNQGHIGTTSRSLVSRNFKAKIVNDIEISQQHLIPYFVLADKEYKNVNVFMALFG
jgi:hypothetical protein